MYSTLYVYPIVYVYTMKMQHDKPVTLRDQDVINIFSHIKPTLSPFGVSGSVPCSVREGCKGLKHIHSPRPHR